MLRCRVGSCRTCSGGRHSLCPSERALQDEVRLPSRLNSGWAHAQVERETAGAKKADGVVEPLMPPAATPGAHATAVALALMDNMRTVAFFILAVLAAPAAAAHGSSSVSGIATWGGGASGGDWGDASSWSGYPGTVQVQRGGHSDRFVRVQDAARSLTRVACRRCSWRCAVRGHPKWADRYGHGRGRHGQQLSLYARR